MSHSMIPATLPHLERANSLCEVLIATSEAHRDRLALRSHESGLGWTYGQLMARVGEVASRLRAAGVGRGDVVAIMLRNTPEFHAVDAAAMMLGAASFSLYNSAPAEQLQYVLTDSGARVLVTELDFLPVVQDARRLGAAVEEVFVVDGPAAAGVLNLTDELSAERSTFDFNEVEVQSEDLLTLIYTSGTTGPPKGVELTHRGMLEQLRGVHAALPLEGGGRQISFLPAAHVADRWASHYSALMTYGNTVTTVADAAGLGDALVQTRPTLFGAVPRIWEKLKAGAEAWYPGDLVADATADPRLAAQVRERLGLDEARWVNTGAAPTPAGVITFFDSLDLPLCEVFGMSETSCLLAMNTPSARRPGSVGKPLPGVEVKLAADDELLVRTTQVMRRYRGLPEKTTEAFDDQGWFRTGDIARIDDDGFLWIVDRKKEIIINAAGKNMSPVNIEMAMLSAGRSISQACVIGDGRRFNVALIVPQSTVAGVDAPRQVVADAVRAQVRRANSGLARVEQIKRFALMPAEWLPGSELTPTMKLRRRVIEDKFRSVIDDLYAGVGEHGIDVGDPA